MKQIICTTLFMTLIAITGQAQTIAQLWQQADNANKKDLPQQEISFLHKIVKAAEVKQQYGDLLKAEMRIFQLKAAISPDSIQPAMSYLENKMKTQKSEVQKAVYNAILCYQYRQLAITMPDMIDEYHDTIPNSYAAALANPELLAKTKASDYDAIIDKGVDSEIFNNDMLSVIGFTLNEYEAMHDYYDKTGNRRAACITAKYIIEKTLEYNKRVAALDSLLNVYGDLDVAGSVAVTKASYIHQPNYTLKERYEFIHDAINRWNNWKEISQLRREEQNMTNPSIAIFIPKQSMIPNKAQMAQIHNMRNVNNISLKIYKLNVNGNTQLSPSVKNELQKLQQSATLLKEKTATRKIIQPDGSPYPIYEQHSDSIEIGALPVGVYLLTFTTDNGITKHSLYYVSNVACIGHSPKPKHQRFAVVNATTGQPLPGAKIDLYVWKNGTRHLKTTLTCNNKGEVHYDAKGDESRDVYAYTNTDKAACPSAVASNYYFYNSTSPITVTEIMLDRNIYRPGQTVQMAAVIYENSKGIENKAIANKTIKAILRDSNNKTVSEKELTTDEFGKVHTEFTLPSNALNGQFSLNVNGTRKYFRVEEYKRPTFTVEFDPVDISYKIGDTVTVKGHVRSYAGLPVMQAKVEYKQMLQVPFWVRRYGFYQTANSIYNRDGECLSTGSITTDENGTFTIKVPVISPTDNVNVKNLFCNIKIDADVTDIAGETHSNFMSLAIPMKPGMLTSDLNQGEYLADNLRNITISYLNATGKNVEKNIMWRFDNANWHNAKTDGKSIDIAKEIKSLKSGKHTMTAVCEGDTLRQKFRIFRLTDKIPAEYTNEFFYQDKSSFDSDGSPVTIMLGSSDKDVHVLYSIISGYDEKGTVVEEGTFDISNQYYTRKFSYRPEYGNGLTISVIWVKDGESHSLNYSIKRPEPDNQLKLEWTTFRDRLTPGQQEEWTLSIKHSNSKPADAQFMATMFDESLDQLSKYNIDFSPMIRSTLPSTAWCYSQNDALYIYGSKTIKALNMQYLKFSKLNSKYLGMGSNRFISSNIRTMRKASNMMFSKEENEAADEQKIMGYAASAPSPSPTARKEMPEAATVSYDQASHSSVTGGIDTGSGIPDTPVQIRENLNETAFFYPALHTDKDGNIALKFTLPEALTTWRLVGFAHTKDISTGKIEGESVAQKNIMVQPNIPRFIRIGDNVQIQARISNTSTSTKDGESIILLIDPATEQTIFTASTAFSVESGKTTVATFDYAPDAYTPSLLICKIIAFGEGFSDGEQHYLPILPNKERITKTITFTQTTAGIKTIDIANMFETKDKAKLTVEYTDNPAWLVVQALPQMANPHDNCSVCQAVSLYANTLGQYIANQVPELKTLVTQWKQEQSTMGTLESSLAKNSNLKDILLNETPWVNDADSETEQRRMLATFFDDNLINTRKTSAIEKMQKMQKQDGSWSWMPDMNGSIYITTSVADILVRLNTMAGNQQETRTMLSKALKWLDKQAVKEVEKMKQQQKKSRSTVSFPSHTMLQYIYIRSLDNTGISTEAQQAISYLMPLLKKEIKNQTMYEKAMTAVILQKRGETTNAHNYVQSLKEYTVYKEDMGRYFDTRRASYSWRDYRIPTQAMTIMALQAITPDDKQTISEMQRWLLQEKRAQAWDTPLNSVDAIYTFLCGNKLTTDIVPTKITIDNKPVEMEDATAGLGYRKVVINTPDGKTLTAEKTNEVTSWGNIYAQFMQPTNEITNSGTDMSIKRDIFVINGQNRKALDSTTPLAIGNKIVVRITVTAARDLDFVQITDRRAACMEPTSQLSSYNFGYYEVKKDNQTNYYFDRMTKGKHIIETEYYIDRTGRYNLGSCSAECAYAPEFRTVVKGTTLNVAP